MKCALRRRTVQISNQLSGADTQTLHHGGVHKSHERGRLQLRPSWSCVIHQVDAFNEEANRQSIDKFAEEC